MRVRAVSPASVRAVFAPVLHSNAGAKLTTASAYKLDYILKKKKPAATYFPPGWSIIGAGVLDFRVRNGNGYIHPTMATGILKASKGGRASWGLSASPGGRRIFARHAGEGRYGQGSRPISTARLCASPRLHLRPIDPVVFRGPSGEPNSRG